MAIKIQGENIRKAVKWISDTRQANPKKPIIEIIDIACKEYDLTPKESDFLLRLNKDNLFKDK